MKVLITGSSGFIGSAMVRSLLDTDEHSIVALVRDSDQRNYNRINKHDNYEEACRTGQLRIIHGDLLGDMSGIADDCDAVVHFAAKTFVDHSIREPLPFIESNVMGTYRILEQARKSKVKRYIQISTDEVYGAILEGAYHEDSRINPTNPYAASKAGADALVVSYTHTFGMWTAVTRTENNYGPFQANTKVFPTFVRKASKGEPLPVYGDGKHRRQWLYVDDHISAVMLLLKSDAAPGQIFHVAGSQELENLELAKRILQEFDQYSAERGALEREQEEFHARLKFIEDHNIRPGHDRRYALVCDKMKALGWKPTIGLDEGIRKAVRWYMDNGWWLT